MHWAVRLTGALDRTALSRAVDALVTRHDILRTTFFALEGGPLQRIAGSSSVQVEYVESAQNIEELIALPFDLETGPLLRMHLLKCGNDAHILLLVIHHIISDGWSMSVLCQELSQAYNAYRCDTLPDWTLPGAAGLPVQYADYAAWQRDWLSGAELERQTGYWRDTLAGAPELLELPVDRPRPALQTHSGAWLRRTLSGELTTSLQAVGRAEHCTLFMVLVAAFDMVLARYSGAADVVIGTPIAGRGRTELEGLIGFFVNTLVLRTSVDGNPTFCELLGRVRQTSLDAYAHQDLPFEKLVEVLSPQRNRSYNPVVQVLFTVHNQPVNLFVPDGLKVETVDVGNDASKFDLSVHVAHREGEGDGELQCGFGYNPDLFDAATIEELADCFESVLVAVCTDTDIRLNDMGRLPAPVEATDWSGNLVDRFVAQVRRAPHAEAMRTADVTLSYGELNERANGIAQQLLSLSLAPGAPLIGLLCTYDERLVTGLLGILKAGGVWVPLDPAWPAERLATYCGGCGTGRGRDRPGAPGTGVRVECIALAARDGSESGRHSAGVDRSGCGYRNRCARLHYLYIGFDRHAERRRTNARRCRDPGRSLQRIVTPGSGRPVKRSVRLCVRCGDSGCLRRVAERRNVMSADGTRQRRAPGRSIDRPGKTRGRHDHGCTCDAFAVSLPVW